MTVGWSDTRFDMAMKTIGITTGLARPGSIICYRMINELIAGRLDGDGLHSAKQLVMAQTASACGVGRVGTHA